jgi:hypothetical protein
LKKKFYLTFLVYKTKEIPMEKKNRQKQDASQGVEEYFPPGEPIRYSPIITPKAAAALQAYKQCLKLEALGVVPGVVADMCQHGLAWDDTDDESTALS